MRKETKSYIVFTITLFLIGTFALGVNKLRADSYTDTEYLVDGKDTVQRSYYRNDGEIVFTEERKPDDPKLYKGIFPMKWYDADDNGDWLDENGQSSLNVPDGAVRGKWEDLSLVYEINLVAGTYNIGLNAINGNADLPEEEGVYDAYQVLLEITGGELEEPLTYNISIEASTEEVHAGYQTGIELGKEGLYKLTFTWLNDYYVPPIDANLEVISIFCDLLTDDDTTTTTTTTTINTAPNIPTNPDLVIGSVGKLIWLKPTWDGGDPDGDTVSYSLYLGVGDCDNPIDPDYLLVTLEDKPGDQKYISTEKYYPFNFCGCFYWKVVATDSQGASATSDIWKFQTGGIQITSPSEGETILVGDTVIIEWESCGDSLRTYDTEKTVKIEYGWGAFGCGGDPVWQEIVGSTENDGSNEWDTSKYTPSDKSSIRISTESGFYQNRGLFSLVENDDTDTDGDGISDAEDNCPVSNLEATIIIKGCDSGVANHLFDDGCTMSDLVAECADNDGNHGKFVSCVAQLTNDWKKEGLITGKEKGAIQSCLKDDDDDE